MKPRQIAVIAIIALAAVVLYAQLVDNAPRNIYHSASAPATCNFGDVWFKSGAPAGQNLYGCTATNVWTLQAGGSSGPAGPTGPVGPSGGPSGPPGTGASGPAGGSGPTGSSGTSGAGGIGSSGPSGAGTTGASGLSGTSGRIGNSGPSGVGFNGASGATGSSGPGGASGSTGAGASGASGVPGSASSSGAPGPSGPVGPSGVGATGASGVAGSAGASGASGINGASGSTGASGAGAGFYQTVKSNSTAETQRAALNFSSNFILSDSASPSQTNIGMLTPVFNTITITPITANEGIAMTQTSGAAASVDSGSSFAFNTMNIISDTTSGQGGEFTSNFSMYQAFGGSSYAGGINSLSTTLVFNSGPTSSSNINRNYVEQADEFLAYNGDGGTSGTPRGAIFAGNDVIYACGNTTEFCGSSAFSAPYLFNVTGREIDIGIGIGSSTQYLQGISVVDVGFVQGASLDTAFDISGGVGVIGFKAGISFDATHGGNPINTNGTLILTSGSSTVTSGLDISSYSFSGYAIHTPAFTVDGNGVANAQALSASVITASTQMTYTPGSIAPTTGSLVCYKAGGVLGYAAVSAGLVGSCN